MYICHVILHTLLTLGIRHHMPHTDNPVSFDVKEKMCGVVIPYFDQNRDVFCYIQILNKCCRCSRCLSFVEEHLGYFIKTNKKPKQLDNSQLLRKT